jgi:small subunit ribosomal protein S12
MKSRIKKEKPQEKGIVLKVLTMKPKKPNSAIRKIVRIKTNTGKIKTAYIPGEGHNLNQHSIVLIKGGKTKDLPGVKYKVVRGVYDCSGVVKRNKSRSKYGAPKIKK